MEPYVKQEGAGLNYICTRYHIVYHAVLLTEAGFRQMGLERMVVRRSHLHFSRQITDNSQLESIVNTGCFWMWGKIRGLNS